MCTVVDEIVLLMELTLVNGLKVWLPELKREVICKMSWLNGQEWD